MNGNIHQCAAEFAAKMQSLGRTARNSPPDRGEIQSAVQDFVAGIFDSIPTAGSAAGRAADPAPAAAAAPHQRPRHSHSRHKKEE